VLIISFSFYFFLLSCVEKEHAVGLGVWVESTRGAYAKGMSDKIGDSQIPVSRMLW
jgi:hypothetical protein